MSSLKCGSCRNGAMPSVEPPAAFLALNGTACRNICINPCEWRMKTHPHIYWSNETWTYPIWVIFFFFTEWIILSWTEIMSNSRNHEFHRSSIISNRETIYRCTRVVGRGILRRSQKISEPLMIKVWGKKYNPYLLAKPSFFLSIFRGLLQQKSRK